MNILYEIAADIVQLDDDDSELPQRAADYINGGAGVRVGFLCASGAQQDRVAAALRKALERRVVAHNLFPSDNKQGESFLEAAYSIGCHFEHHNLESTRGFIGSVSYTHLTLPTKRIV